MSAVSGNAAPPSRWWAALAHPWTWRMAWRDSRSQRQRLVVFSLSIVAGIAALVAIHLLRATVQAGLEDQAKSLLGSDLHLSSRAAFPGETVAQLAAESRRLSRETGFSSMLYFAGADAARLVYVRGVEGDYPFYGRVETSPPDAWQRLHREPGILIEPALLDQFHAKIGDTVRLGSLELPILGTVLKPPAQSRRFAGFSPECFVRLADLPRTGLLDHTTLAMHHLHLELANPKQARAIKDRFKDTIWRFETLEDRREALGNSLDQAEQFLGLIALAALVLGAIGVAGAIHAHVSRRVTSVAILRCLGCPGELAFSIYLAQAAALGLAGALVGALLGTALHTGVLALFRDSLPIEVSLAPSPRVIAETAATGLLVCLGFALLPLLRVRGVAPIAALRESVDAPAVRRFWPLWLGLAALMFWLNLRNGFHAGRALTMTASLGAAFLLLAGTARGLAALARRVARPSWPYLLRQGISNLHRPHNQTLLFLLSLGLGTFLLVTIVLAKNLLLHEVNVGRFADSPSIYLIDVQPDQLAGVEALLRSRGLPVLESAPMVTMRIQAIRGVPVRDLEKTGAVPKWLLQREFRSTYRDHLAPTEKLVAGQWHASLPDPAGPIPLSLDRDIAKDLHVALGDEVTLDVQGVPVTARVTSLREIDWSRFTLNFFMVFPPGALEGAPGFDVVTTRIPPGGSSGDLQRALVHDFPNVSALDLELVLDTIRGILAKISRVITVLAGFTVLAGLPILIGTLLNGRDQRLRESVLLRTLGASAAQVRAILAVEYATLGALSACTGVLLAVAANAALALFVFKASPWPDPMLLAIAFSTTTALALLAGLALSRGASRHPPLEILRATG